jgi:hypothetical protein
MLKIRSKCLEELCETMGKALALGSLNLRSKIDVLDPAS